jgi:3',5'-cyclic AMP phosphodiesterase CpdA
MPKPDPDVAPRFLLDYLVTHHPALFSVDELTGVYSGGQDLEAARFAVTEGVATLAGHGLVHRLDDFVFASRAAVRGHALNSM